MKHLKKFEEYKEGDIVILNVNKMKQNNVADGLKADASIEDSEAEIIETGGPLYPYDIEFYNGETTSVNDEEILRKQTPEEEQKYILKRAKFSVNKYNL